MDAGEAGARRVSPPTGRANQTMEPVEPPWQAIKEWVPDDEPGLDWFNRPRDPTPTEEGSTDQRSIWCPEEARLDDERILVIDPN